MPNQLSIVCGGFLPTTFSSKKNSVKFGASLFNLKQIAATIWAPNMLGCGATVARQVLTLKIEVRILAAEILKIIQNIRQLPLLIRHF